MIVTEEHKKVLEWMDDEQGYYYHALEEKTGIPVKRLKKIMLEMKLSGYVVYTPFIDDDGMCSGSGHLLTYPKGIELKNSLNL